MKDENKEVIIIKVSFLIKIFMGIISFLLMILISSIAWIYIHNLKAQALRDTKLALRDTKLESKINEVITTLTFNYNENVEKDHAQDLLITKVESKIMTIEEIIDGRKQAQKYRDKKQNLKSSS